MFDSDDDVLARVIRRLRQPVEIDPAFDARVMARVTTGAAPGTIWSAAWDWLRRPRDISITPLAGLLTAAALVGLAVWLGTRRPPLGQAPRQSARAVQFVVVINGASSVALVGDFNDWDGTATPMHPAPGAIWSVTVPLTTGRHRYAFVVDGSRWLADPGAPRAQDDFDTPSSIVTVGG